MKIPHIRIEWKEPNKSTAVIQVEKLYNGYIIGSTYYATEEKMLAELLKYLKDPYAYHEAPVYKDEPLNQ